MEELIGEITDEYDVEDVGAHDQVGDVEGLTGLQDFEERFGYVLPEGPYDTVAGFVMAQMGRLPAEGAEVEVLLERSPSAAATLPEQARLVFTVTELDGRRAAWLSVRRVEPAVAGATQASPDAGAQDEGRE